MRGMVCNSTMLNWCEEAGGADTSEAMPNPVAIRFLIAIISLRCADVPCG